MGRYFRIGARVDMDPSCRSGSVRSPSGSAAAAGMTTCPDGSVVAAGAACPVLLRRRRQPAVSVDAKVRVSIKGEGRRESAALFLWLTYKFDQRLSSPLRILCRRQTNWVSVHREVLCLLL